MIKVVILPNSSVFQLPLPQLVNISWQRLGFPPSSSALIWGIQLNAYNSYAYFIMILKCTMYENHYLWDRLQTKETMGEKKVDYFPITQTKSLKK